MTISHRAGSHRYFRHLLFAAIACGLGIFAPHASAALPKAAVVIGDSFSSGEAGRWGGNSFTGIDGGDRADTDLAATYREGDLTYQLDIPYMVNSIENGCNRSNWAPISHLKKHFSIYPQGFDAVVNLACSGARNKHLWPIASGGEWFKGEAPQIARLGIDGGISDTYDIDLIVIGVGGNDMGFSGAVTACALAWVKKHWTFEDDASCIDDIDGTTLPKLTDAYFNVGKTIKLVKQKMAEINDTNYKIVLMGYPAIIPGFNNWRYDAGMRRIRNCPFNGLDAAYVDEVLLPKLNSTMEAIASQEGVDFINLHNAFDQHRLCEQGLGTRMVEVNTPTSLNNEWVRYLDTTGLTSNAYKAAIAAWRGTADGTELGYIAGDQGTLSESLHPNQFGQQAIGDCLKEYRAAAMVTNKAFKCTNNGSGHAFNMRLDLQPAPPSIVAPTDAVIPDGSGSLSIYKTLSSSGRPGDVMRSELKIIHPKKGHLKISIRSPSGRIYMIKEVNLSDGGAFPSVSNNFFYDAPAEIGMWTLKIEDKVGGVSGNFLDWAAYYY